MTIDAITQSMVDGGDISRTSRHRWAQLYVARCAGGSGLAVHLSSSDAFWTKLARALGRNDLLEDPRFATYHDRVRHYDLIVDRVSEGVARRPLEEWEHILEAADVPFAPLLTPSEAMRLPQVQAIALDDPDCVPTGASLLRPLRFDGSRPTRRRPEPEQ
jgi:crotonobetainyl-CoA:carnitine CoA-transferase CaiB-like acyl-CoA transferase